MKVFRTLLLFSFLLSKNIYAQMPHDAVYMGGRTTCSGLIYTNSSWNQYWENNLKRTNLNLGTHTTQSVMAMAAIGFSPKLNVIVSIPYVKTSTSAGNLMGQSGFQDLSAWLKYKFLQKGNGISLHAIVGGSVPVSNYVPDFLPMSIGMQAKTATARLLFNYRHKTGLYFTSHASYTSRSRINIDRDSYYASYKMFTSNQVNVPDAADYAARIGYIKYGIQFEGFAEKLSCVSGDYIRRNDMPFPTNDMKATLVGVYGKYQPNNWGFNFRVSRVLDGLNMGQALSLSAGLLYQFSYYKKQKTDN